MTLDRINYVGKVLSGVAAMLMATATIGMAIRRLRQLTKENDEQQ